MKSKLISSLSHWVWMSLDQVLWILLLFEAKILFSLSNEMLYNMWFIRIFLDYHIWQNVSYNVKACTSNSQIRKFIIIEHDVNHQFALFKNKLRLCNGLNFCGKILYEDWRHLGIQWNLKIHYSTVKFLWIVKIFIILYCINFLFTLAGLGR